MSGLLNEALDGLDRLEERREFSYSKGTKEIKDLWIRQSDSFTAFCLDHIEENSEGTVTKHEIRKFFSKYCKKHKIKGCSDVYMKTVLEHNYGVIESQVGENRERVWIGIILKNYGELLIK